MVLYLSAILAGCGGKALDDADKYVSAIEEVILPGDIKVIGLGEATHGNVELQQLKKMFFVHKLKTKMCGFLYWKRTLAAASK